eukprot:4455334-Ditylum_brightwellii.AAC.1
MVGWARLDPVNAHASMYALESFVISAKVSTPRYSHTLFNLSSVASPGCEATITSIRIVLCLLWIFGVQASGMIMLLLQETRKDLMQPNQESGT